MPPTTPTNPIPKRPDTPDPTGRPIVQTFEKDMSLAMDTTDATVVQELLQTAREKETFESEKESVRHQKGWYTTGGLILILLAVSALVYGVYYYKHLTVRVAPSVSVGVFQSLPPLIAPDTSVQEGLAQIQTTADLPEGKPFLIPVVSNGTALTPLSNEALLSYVGANASEPFIAAVSLVRLGVMNTGTHIVPFLLFSVPNPEIATKEFLIAEPTLLSMVAPVLGIDLSIHENEIGKGFTSTYMYNLPVRTLTTYDIDTQEDTLLFYYGYATANTIVVATNPSVLKGIYDTIIRQH